MSTPLSTRLRPVGSTYLLVAAALAAALSGCGGTDSPSPPGTPSSAEATALGHVHGLGVDPGDNTLYVASHYGVFRVTADGERERVADRWQDTMGFAVVGPGHFLGSGHPDLNEEDLPSSLGLIESTDGAETWDAVSLLGDADLHAIEPVGDRIYAYDSHTGALITTTNRADWDTIATLPIYDLAANPDDPATVYATTDRGVLISSTDQGEPVEVSGAPTLTGMDWQSDGPLVGVAPDGAVMVTDDPTTAQWRQVGSLDGFAEAVDAIAGRWHAATATGVYESVDDGATWRLVVAQDH
ncbi:F510_1955 family glycosylhydrolase [Nocardioides sp.]|uniref:F510_1955 family glycosylhydrolase n=1 Tax=Nocardioides sp. TaxID=35761 RepID=UPI002B890DD6|nr:hypothetical protein [Nocardioides sp.]HXH80336.1 hypothetical protein [Nocardioides sp.]